jgi:vancomycin aglycone glucosyltransferase
MSADVLPLAPCAQQRAAHAVVFARAPASSGFAGAGSAASNGADIEAAMHAPDAKLESLRWQFRLLKDQHRAHVRADRARSEGAALIMGRGATGDGLGRRMARRAAREHRVLSLRDTHSRAPPPTVRTQTLPPWVNRLLWDVGGAVADLALRDTINRGRATLGLPPIDGPFAHIFDSGVVVAADRDLAPLDDDAPASSVSTDAWIFDDAQTPDPRVEAFLSLSPAPIYIGFGSMVAERLPDLAAHAIAATRLDARPSSPADGPGFDRHVSKPTTS